MEATSLHTFHDLHLWVQEYLDESNHVLNRNDEEEKEKHIMEGDRLIDTLNAKMDVTDDNDDYNDLRLMLDKVRKSRHLITGNKCTILSGLSGSGKTTIGELFCAKNGWKFIDGDSFFLRDKPKVTLSNGEVASNWDDP